jgi:hypothetical protein
MHSPQGKLDPLACCSYLDLKLKNVVFNQQKSTFLKPKQLPFMLIENQSPINKKFLENIWRNLEDNCFHKGLGTTFTSKIWQWGHLWLWKIWNLNLPQGISLHFIRANMITCCSSWPYVYKTIFFGESTRPLSLFEGIFCGNKCEKLWKNSFTLAICVHEQRTMPLAIWFIVITLNSWKSMVVYFYGLYHRPLML